MPSKRSSLFTRCMDARRFSRESETGRRLCSSHDVFWFSFRLREITLHSFSHYVRREQQNEVLRRRQISHWTFEVEICGKEFGSFGQHEPVDHANGVLHHAGGHLDICEKSERRSSDECGFTFHGLSFSRSSASQVDRCAGNGVRRTALNVAHFFGAFGNVNGRFLDEHLLLEFELTAESWLNERRDSSDATTSLERRTYHEILDVDRFRSVGIGQTLDDLLEASANVLLRCTGGNGADFFERGRSDETAVCATSSSPLIVRCAPSCRQAM